MCRRYGIYFSLVGVFCLIVSGCGLFVDRIPQGHIKSPTELDHFIKVDTVNYHYRSYPADGEHVVLLHGFASSTYTWEDLAPRLQAEGYHVWSLDMKGFGWSDKPRDARYDPVTLMEDVNKWMDALDLHNVILVGNSLGGAITVLIALEHPERIKKMVLIDSAGYPMRLPLIIRMAHLPLSGSFMKLFFGRWMVRWNLKEVFYHKDRVTEEKVNAYYVRMCTKNALDAQTTVARSVKFDLFDDYIKRVPQITSETLIIWGENDAWIPLEIGYKFKKDLTTATMIVIPECGHMPQEEYPQKTAQYILEFIKGKNNGNSLPHGVTSRE